MTRKRPIPPPPSHPDFELIETKVGFERFLRLDIFRFRHRLFCGEWSPVREYDVVRRGEAVAVVLYDPSCDSVVLIEQFRLPPLLAGDSPWQLEAVAGLVDGDGGESPSTVAIRETLEETGLMLEGDPIPIQRYFSSAGASDECVHLFCGRIDAAHAGGIHGLPDEHEDIRVVVKSIPEIEALLTEGTIASGHTLIALYWLLAHRERLRREWL